MVGMDVCHILLRKSWQFDHYSVYDEFILRWYQSIYLGKVGDERFLCSINVGG